MPSIPELCQMLDVKPGGSDPISLNDLTSARKTRQAIHRELIKRRPGIYPRRWLAARLGVCKETLDAYNRDIPIHFKHLFHETHINWSNLNRVPAGVVIPGAFLEDNEGKRYPAQRQIAAHLLRQGRAVRFKQQDANYYWYEDSPPTISLNLGLHPNQHQLEARQQEVRHYVDRWNQLHSSPSEQPPSPPQPEKEMSMIPDRRPAPPASLVPQTPGGSYRRSLAEENQEAFAHHLYNQVRAINTDPAHGLSLVTARRLVDTHSRPSIETALKTISTRKNISNPVGLLITILRSNLRSCQEF